MLVIPDQVSGRVRAEGRLPGATEPEEEGHVALAAHVARGVQRQRPFRWGQVPLGSQGHVVHHHRKDTLLHLPGILRAEDHHLPPAQRQGHGGGGGHAGRVPIAREATCQQQKTT